MDLFVFLVLVFCCWGGGSLCLANSGVRMQVVSFSSLCLAKFWC